MYSSARPNHTPPRRSGETGRHGEEEQVDSRVPPRCGRPRPARGGPGPASDRPLGVARHGAHRSGRRDGHHHGAGRVATHRTRSDPPRQDERLAVHVLPRHGRGDGLRSLPHTDHRPDVADLRRRPPVELRRLQRPRPTTRLRPERFRRDADRAVRMGREAARGEHHPRRPAQRLQGEGDSKGHPVRRHRLP